MHTHLLQAQVLAAILRVMPELDDATLATWRGFLNAHARVTRRISAELSAAGLPDLSWYDLLWALYRQPARSLRVNELAREIVLSPPAMSRFVDRLAAAGCVRREPDPDDRRAQRVVLTEEGIDLLRRMWPVYKAGIEAHFAAHLGGSPQGIRAVLERIAE